MVTRWGRCYRWRLLPLSEGYTMRVVRWGYTIQLGLPDAMMRAWPEGVARGVVCEGVSIDRESYIMCCWPVYAATNHSPRPPAKSTSPRKAQSARTQYDILYYPFTCPAWCYTMRVVRLWRYSIASMRGQVVLNPQHARLLLIHALDHTPHDLWWLLPLAPIMMTPHTPRIRNDTSIPAITQIAIATIQ